MLEWYPEIYEFLELADEATHHNFPVLAGMLHQSQSFLSARHYLLMREHQIQAEKK